MVQLREAAPALVELVIVLLVRELGELVLVVLQALALFLQQGLVLHLCFIWTLPFSLFSLDVQ